MYAKIIPCANFFRFGFAYFWKWFESFSISFSRKGQIIINILIVKDKNKKFAWPLSSQVITMYVLWYIWQHKNWMQRNALWSSFDLVNWIDQISYGIQTDGKFIHIQFNYQSLMKDIEFSNDKTTKYYSLYTLSILIKSCIDRDEKKSDFLPRSFIQSSYCLIE